MLVTSVFKNGQRIPDKYSHINPPLNITRIPTGTEHFLIIIEDPDAPNGTYTHLKEMTLPNSRFMEGSFFNYKPLSPPSGETHRYVFIIQALDNLNKILAKSKLIGLYGSLKLDMHSKNMEMYTQKDEPLILRKLEADEKIFANRDPYKDPKGQHPLKLRFNKKYENEGEYTLEHFHSL